MGEEGGWGKDHGRKTTARAVVVETTPERLICLICSKWLKPIEFEKGKPAIAVSSLDKLPSIIDTLITTIWNGELDQQFADALRRRSRRSQKESVRHEGSGGWHFAPLPLNCLRRPIAPGLPLLSCRRWSRNKSRISNNAKHDGHVAYSDTRSIRGQLVHCRNARSSFRSVKNL